MLNQQVLSVVRKARNGVVKGVATGENWNCNIILTPLCIDNPTMNYFKHPAEVLKLHQSLGVKKIQTIIRKKRFYLFRLILRSYHIAQTNIRPEGIPFSDTI